MAATINREYELVLMLDPEMPEERREQIAAEARTRIESGGSIQHDTSWGMRKLAYEIRQRTEADYRFFRFQTGEELLNELDHNLRIADGVLRFRIFKVEPGSPAIVPPAPLASGAPTPSRGSRRPQGGPAPAPPEQASEPAEPAAPESAEAAENAGSPEAEQEAPSAPSGAEGDEAPKAAEGDSEPRGDG